jgi:hypothetical protein
MKTMEIFLYIPASSFFLYSLYFCAPGFSVFSGLNLASQLQ